MASAFPPPYRLGPPVQGADDDWVLGEGFDVAPLEYQTDALMRAINPNGVPQYQQQQSPALRLGRFSIPGEGLDAAALAILQQLQAAPRRPRNFGEGLLQGAIGGFAGARAQGAESRQKFNEEQRQRQARAEDEARGERSKAAFTLRRWQLDERARKQRELEDTVPNTPELRQRLSGQNIYVDPAAARVPRSALVRDMPVRAEQNPVSAEIAQLRLEMLRRQIDEKAEKQESDEADYQRTVDEVANFRQSPSSVLKGARGGDAMKYRNRLIADVNQRLAASNSKWNFAKLEAAEKERDNFYKTQNQQRFTALRQASVTVSKHLKQLEDFYKDFRGEYEKQRKRGWLARIINPGEWLILNQGLLAAAENGMLGPDAVERAQALRGTSAAVAREASLVFSSGFAPLDQDIAEARHNITAAIGPRGHKGQVKALRNLLRARIETAWESLPFAAGKDNPYLLEVSPIRGWEEGEAAAGADRLPSKPSGGGGFFDK